MTESPPGRPALRRRTEHRLLAGVAGGLADWLNAPVAFIRVVLALVCASSEVALAVYVAAALLIPARGHNRPGWDNLIGAGRVGILFIAPAVAFGGELDLDAFFDEPPSIWISVLALELVGLSVLLSSEYVRGRPRTDDEARETVLATAPVVCSGIVLAVAVVLFPDVRWERMVPAVVLVGGVALALAVARGRARAYVTPAVLSVVLGAGLVASGARLEGGVGDVTLVGDDLADGRLVVRRAAGDVTVDLRRVDAGRPVTLVASVGRGKLHVGVPNRARVAVDVHVGQGRIYTLLVNRGSRDAVGFDSHLRHVYRTRDSDAPRIRVIADVGTGEFMLDSAENFETAAVR